MRWTVWSRESLTDPQLDPDDPGLRLAATDSQAGHCNRSATTVNQWLLQTSYHHWAQLPSFAGVLDMETADNPRPGRSLQEAIDRQTKESDRARDR